MSDSLLENIAFTGVSSSHLRRSSRAKRMRIELRPDCSLLIVIPQRMREDQWLSFVLSKKNWIETTARRYSLKPPSRTKLERPSCIDIVCMQAQYSICVESAKRNRVSLAGRDLTLYCTDMSDDQIFLNLRQWLVSQARKEFTARLGKISASTGLEWNKLSIRGQKTRWGSCSANKNISLNFKLLFLPSDLVDHVLLHELVHTREMNHSRRFWSLMERYDSEFAQHRVELRGAGLLIPDWVGKL